MRTCRLQALSRQALLSLPQGSPSPQCTLRGDHTHTMVTTHTPWWPHTHRGDHTHTVVTTHAPWWPHTHRAEPHTPHRPTCKPFKYRDVYVPTHRTPPHSHTQDTQLPMHTSTLTPTHAPSCSPHSDTRCPPPPSHRHARLDTLSVPTPDMESLLQEAINGQTCLLSLHRHMRPHGTLACTHTQ